MRSNCVIWAAFAWWRLRKRRFCGISPRRSHYGPFPHFRLAFMRRDGSLRYVSYKPVAPRPRLIPPPLFVGRMMWGD